MMYPISKIRKRIKVRLPVRIINRMLLTQIHLQKHFSLKQVKESNLSKVKKRSLIRSKRFKSNLGINQRTRLKKRRRSKEKRRKAITDIVML